jgi:hypothetical protein
MRERNEKKGRRPPYEASETQVESGRIQEGRTKEGSVRGCVKLEFVQTELLRELRACYMVLLLSEVCC